MTLWWKRYTIIQ